MEQIDFDDAKFISRALGGILINLPSGQIVKAIDKSHLGSASNNGYDLRVYRTKSGKWYVL